MLLIKLSVMISGFATLHEMQTALHILQYVLIVQNSVF